MATKLGFDWDAIVPGGSSAPDLDMTGAVPVPQAKLDEFTREDGSVNTRGLGKIVRRVSGGHNCIKTINGLEGYEDGIYVLSVDANPQLASKPKAKRGTRRTK